MTGLLWLLRLVVALILATVLGALTLWCGPDIEARFAPVVTGQTVDAITLSPDKAEVCWTWRFDKDRVAQPDDAGWTLRAGRDIFPFLEARSVASSQAPTDALVERPTGAGQWTRKCADVPERLRGRSFRITGFVEYRTPQTGRFWSVRHRTAEGFVP